MVISYLFRGNKKNNWRYFAKDFPLKIFCMSTLGRSREGPKKPKTLWNVHEKSNFHKHMTNFNHFNLSCIVHLQRTLQLSAWAASRGRRSGTSVQREPRCSPRQNTCDMMILAMANYQVQHHNFKINLSPSVSSCRRSLSTTRPTVSAPRFGEWGILEKI